ncbi:MAG: hypothetical protein A2180_02860 [Pseudomonadales bacterium GWC2_63_15]|nr:MAG: hypothetical protein A2180_02860 [Pseudomonadales bacterium GWC2_63_15]
MSANQKPRAYSYIRFSNATQAAGDSYRRQREAAEAYCAQHGLELVDAKEYSFFDQGRSAYKARHLDDTGELARFLAFVQDGTIPKGSTLLVESLDRLSRERVKDALPRFLDLLNQGINVVTLADGRLYTSAYNELDLIISIVQMSRAHEESATKGKRVSAAWRRKQDSARTESLPIGKLRPLWLDYTPDGYVPNPERVEVVQRIYKLAQDGYGHRAIAAQLNQSGVPSFSADRKNASGLWGNSGIARTLSNRAVLGEYQPHQFIDGKRVPVGAPITGFYPPIITEDEFYAAQQAVSSRRQSQATKPGKRFNVWQGVSQCGICEGPMHISKRGNSRILRCFRNIQGLCPAKPILLPRSEEVFREILAKVDSLALVQSNQGKLQRQIAVCDGRIAEAQERIESLQSQILNLSGALPVSIISVMQRLEEDLAKHQQERDSLKEDIAREQIINKDEFFSRLDLVSYEGRARANSLLKSLSVEVAIERIGELRGKKAPVDYRVSKEGFPIFSFLDTSGELEFLPLTTPSIAIAEVQGEVIRPEFYQYVLTRERQFAWEASERTRLEELCKTSSFKDVAAAEGISVRGLKRILVGRSNRRAP